MKQVTGRCSPAFIATDEKGAKTVGRGIRRQMLGYGPDLMLCRVWLAKGAIGAVHAHHHSQSSYVESGRFLVRVGEGERELGPGDSFYVAPHMDHGAVCLEDGVLLDTFSPARDDFLSADDASC